MVQTLMTPSQASQYARRESLHGETRMDLDGLRETSMPDNKSSDADRPAYRRNRAHGISAAEFCIIWEDSETVDEAARRMGMPKDICIARAADYRHKNIRLKQMRRGRKNTLDVESLNELIRKTREKREELSAEAVSDIMVGQDDQAAREAKDALERAVREVIEKARKS